jgi:hypothetical protein
MAWETIKPTQYQRVQGGINIWDYLLKNHGYEVPPIREEALQGITLTFTPMYMYLYEAKRPTDLTSRQIEHLDPKGLMAHYYITFDSIWQTLEDTRCWQKQNGEINDKTISIAMSTQDCLVPPMYKEVPLHMGEMLTAYLLHKYKLTVNNIKVTKDAPQVFVWKDFKAAVTRQMKKL